MYCMRSYWWTYFVRGRINDHTLLDESGELFHVIGHKYEWGMDGLYLMFSRNVINNRGVGGERKDMHNSGK